MIIGIDISMLVYAGSGVATYTYNLVKNLLIFDKKNEYKLFYSSFRRPDNIIKQLDEFRKLGAQVYDHHLPPRILKFTWNKHHFLDITKLIGPVDVYHSSDFLRPPLPQNTLSITTIHDLTWKLFPQYHTPDIIRAHEKKLEKTIKYGDLVIVDSKNTKNDLLRLYPEIDSKKIKVIYLGIDERYKLIKNQVKIKRVLKKCGLNYPANYLLYVGAIEPRKNLETTVKVFSQLIKDPEFSDYKFLLVGRAGWKNEKLFNLIDKLNLKDKVIFVGFVIDDDLPYFYNAAKLTLYLSKYEGFGLPPLESLKSGTPTLALANSSVKEIVPEEFLVKDDEKEILKKLKYLLKHKVKNKLKEDEFSWKKYVKEFLKVINENK